MDFLFPVETGLVFCQNEFLTMLLLKIQASWDVTLRCWVSGSQCVEMLCCFILKGNQPMTVILCGLITLEEECCVVSEWFPVSILNDCVCVTSIFLIPRRVIFVGWLPLKLREGQSSEILGASDPKTMHRFPENTDLQHWYLIWHIWRNTLNSSSCCSLTLDCAIPVV